MDGAGGVLGKTYPALKKGINQPEEVSRWEDSSLHRKSTYSKTVAGASQPPPGSFYLQFLIEGEEQVDIM
jgi:hypothetical protein